MQNDELYHFFINASKHLDYDEQLIAAEVFLRELLTFSSEKSLLSCSFAICDGIQFLLPCEPWGKMLDDGIFPSRS